MSEVIEVNAKGLDMKLLKPAIDGQVDNANIFIDMALEHVESARKIRKKLALDLIEIDLVSIRKILKGIKEIIVGD